MKSRPITTSPPCHHEVEPQWRIHSRVLTTLLIFWYHDENNWYFLWETSGNCVLFQRTKFMVKIYHTVSNNTKNKTRSNKKLYYLTNGHNRLATGTIKAFCYEMNILTIYSLFWKVKRVLSCVVLIVEITVLVLGSVLKITVLVSVLVLGPSVLVLLLTVLVPSLTGTWLRNPNVQKAKMFRFAETNTMSRNFVV